MSRWAVVVLVILSGCSSDPALPTLRGTASWYSTEACRVNPDPACPTASGQSLYDLERAGVLFAASTVYPLGTRLLVRTVPSRAVAIGARSAKTSVVATVRDRGPHPRLGRVLDLSKSAFARLAPLSQGLIEVEVIPLR